MYHYDVLKLIIESDYLYLFIRKNESVGYSIKAPTEGFTNIHHEIGTNIIIKITKTYASFGR